MCVCHRLKRNCDSAFVEHIHEQTNFTETLFRIYLFVFSSKKIEMCIFKIKENCKFAANAVRFTNGTLLSCLDIVFSFSFSFSILLCTGEILCGVLSRRNLCLTHHLFSFLLLFHFISHLISPSKSNLCLSVYMFFHFYSYAKLALAKIQREIKE